MKHGLLLLAALLVLTGCASSRVPQAISNAPPEQPAVSEVQQHQDRYLGRRVRWGGTIVAVLNLARTTEIEVLSRPLDKNGEPREKAPGEGRFIAVLPGFADPAEYPVKRLLTVTGTLVNLETRLVGEYPYRFPLVAVENRYLWPEPLPPIPPYYYGDPRFYPWYRPWNPWYGPWYY